MGGALRAAIAANAPDAPKVGGALRAAIAAKAPDAPKVGGALRAAIAANAPKRFGFITTNSLRQTFNRRVLEAHMSAKEPLSLLFAIPDHPWVDSTDGAAVRISMTVATAGSHPGLLQRVVAEEPGRGEGREVILKASTGIIHPDLTSGADVSSAMTLKANEEISCPGVKLHGSGFMATPVEASQLGLGRIDGLEQHIRLYRNGRDLTATPRDVMVIDLFGLSAEQVQSRFPEVYQWVLNRVKPERDQNNRASYRDNWWIFGEPRRNFRPALVGLTRYIATVETSKHRFFVFLDASILPDNKLVCIAQDDAYIFGIVSSTIHERWTLAACGWMGVGNDPIYNKTRCFETFPFPDATDDQKARIRELGERLDAHRKRQQQLHPALTLTNIYNVLEKLRAGDPLTAKEKIIHEQGLVTTLRQLHDDLDAAVLDAYGWSDLRTATAAPETEQQLLQRLVDLNHLRAAEEATGHIRYLRPDYQAPTATAPTPTPQDLDLDDEAPPPTAAPAPLKLTWPSSLPEQFQAITTALSHYTLPVDATSLARHFGRATPKRVAEIEGILQTLVSLGQAKGDGGGYVAK